MRRCLIGDLIEAAVVVAAAAPDQRLAFAFSLIDQAHCAHQYAKKFGKAHSVWGNGSLMARAMAHDGPRIARRDDPAFLAGLSIVAAALASRKQHRLCLQSKGAALALSRGLAMC